MATIVPFEPRHVEGVVRLCEAEGWPSWSNDSVHAAFAAPGVLALIAEDGETVVGAAHLLTDGTVIAYLGLLVVAAEARGEGIGRALVDELFRRSGLRRIDVLSEDGSTAFYESLPHRSKPGYRLYSEPRSAA
jgi:predicted N-acetyltransferase YhbS